MSLVLKKGERRFFNDFCDVPLPQCYLNLMLEVLLELMSLVRTCYAQVTTEILSKPLKFYSWQKIINNSGSSPGCGDFLELMKSLHMRKREGHLLS